MDKKLKIWHFNRHTLLCIFFIILEQGIVAASTFALAWLTKSITGRGNILLSFIIFCLLLILVYIPSIAVHYEAELAKYKMFFDNIALASGKNYGCTGALFNKQIFGLKAPYLNNELWIVISENVEYAVDFLQYFLIFYLIQR